MKQLSIIIPHFNSVKLLKRLIKSIPVTNEIEIIVIDDNSTKNINEYYSMVNGKEYGHVSFYKNDTLINSAGTCRNIGLDKAKGEWVLFADADDYFMDNFYDIISIYFNTEYEVVHFTPTSIFIDNKESADRHIKYEKLIKNYNNDNSLENETRLRYEYGVPWSKLIRRNFIEKHNIRFDEVVARNDKMFSTKVGYYMERFCVSSEVIYCVTRNKGSTTMTISEEMLQSRLDVFIRHYKFVEEKLSREQKGYLNLSGFNVILSTVRSGMGIKQTIFVYKKLRNNRIRIFDKRFLNPIFIVKRTILILNMYKNERKYYSK